MKWLVSVILGLLPISAFASDMNYPTKAMPSYYNWSGFYAGLNVGGAFGNASVTDTNGGVPAGPYAYQPKGVFGGGQAGFNYQWQNVVLGIEGDLGYMNPTSGKGLVPSSNPAYHQDLTVSGGVYADMTARLGYAFGSLLFYGKGGYAYVDTSASQTTTKPGYATTGTGAFDGAVYGGGIEYAFARQWTIKAEYLRFDLGSRGAYQTSITDAPIGFQYLNTTSLKFDTVKIGANYRF